MKSELFEGRISNGRALTMAIATVPTIQKPAHSKSGLLLSGFQLVFHKMAAISLDLKWLGFWNSDPIQNLENL